MTQRNQHNERLREGTVLMDRERIDKLEHLGFEWSRKRKNSILRSRYGKGRGLLLRKEVKVLNRKEGMLESPPRRRSRDLKVPVWPTFF
jgi:hypothetical protein